MIKSHGQMAFCASIKRENLRFRVDISLFSVSQAEQIIRIEGTEGCVGDEQCAAKFLREISRNFLVISHELARSDSLAAQLHNCTSISIFMKREQLNCKVKLMYTSNCECWVAKLRAILQIFLTFVHLPDLRKTIFLWIFPQLRNFLFAFFFLLLFLARCSKCRKNNFHFFRFSQKLFLGEQFSQNILEWKASYYYCANVSKAISSFFSLVRFFLSLAT